MSSATCCMTNLVSFPSRYIRIEYILLLTDQRRLRTINDDRDLVVDSLYTVINAGHPLVDTGHPVVDASHSIVDVGHPIVDIEYLIVDHPHSIINSMRGLQH